MNTSSFFQHLLQYQSWVTKSLKWDRLVFEIRQFRLIQFRDSKKLQYSSVTGFSSYAILLQPWAKVIEVYLWVFHFQPPLSPRLQLWKLYIIILCFLWFYFSNSLFAPYYLIFLQKIQACVWKLLAVFLGLSQKSN